MKRTTIMLPAKLKATAERRARKRGLSLASLIRLSLERELANGEAQAHASARPARPEDDPFLTDTVTFKDNWPGDVSSNLDHYLYGDGRDLP